MHLQTGGRIGETSALLLLLGGIFLVYKKIISPRIPLIIFATIGLFAFILGPEGLFTGSWQTVIGHIISGGAMLGRVSSLPSTTMISSIFGLSVIDPKQAVGIFCRVGRNVSDRFLPQLRDFIHYIMGIAGFIALATIRNRG